jgi:hypothetical protein
MSKKRTSVPVVIEHEPRTAGEALLVTTVVNRERQERGVIYTEGIEYPDGKPTPGPIVEPYKVQIKRATSELAGIYPFVFNAISYVLSHKELHGGLEIMKTGYYDSITMPVDVFLDITLDDTKNIRPFLMSEIAKSISHPMSKAVPYDENYTVFGQPVIVVFGNDKTGKFIKNINRYEIRHDETVQILFMKCFFRDEKGHIQEPKAIYAHLIEEQLLYNASIKAKSAQMLLTDGQQTPEPTDLTIKSDPYVQTSAINRVREYLFHHDNGYSPKIHYDVIDMLNHTQPQHVRQSGIQKGQIKHYKEAKEFVTKALTVICNLYKTETLGRRPLSFNSQWGLTPQLEVTFGGTTEDETEEKQLFIETKHYGDKILVAPIDSPDKR